MQILQKPEKKIHKKRNPPYARRPKRTYLRERLLKNVNKQEESSRRVHLAGVCVLCFILFTMDYLEKIINESILFSVLVIGKISIENIIVLIGGILSTAGVLCNRVYIESRQK